MQFLNKEGRGEGEGEGYGVRGARGGMGGRKRGGGGR